MSVPQIIGLSFTEILGDYAYKQFSNHGGISNFLLGTVGYIGVIIMLIISLQNSTLLLVNTAWDGMSCLMENSFAYFILGERFQSIHEYIGMFIIIIGLFLLKIPWKKEKVFNFPLFFTPKISKG
jgi:multidrug transporter EmrE-like cation transporter